MNHQISMLTDLVIHLKCCQGISVNSKCPYCHMIPFKLVDHVLSMILATSEIIILNCCSWQSVDFPHLFQTSFDLDLNLFRPLCKHDCVNFPILFRSFQGRGALQDIDQMSLFKPLCKYCASVTKIRDIVPTLKKALHEAQSGTPGKTRSDWLSWHFTGIPCQTMSN